MTYYEELGISATASPEEIRQAYKQLARLVHPDHCGDEHTRRLADLQMKRLNGMVEVLLDPVGRERYDRSLMALASAVAGQPLHTSTEEARDWRHLAAAGIPCAAAILILVLGVSPTRPALRPTPAPEEMAEIPPMLRPEVKHGNVRPIQRQQPAVEPNGDSPLPHLDEASVSVPELPVSNAPVLPNPPIQLDSVAPAPVQRDLSGNWFSVPDGSKYSREYLPEYIELRIKQENGVIRGRYLGRYHVPDRAISPTVAFQFEGTLSPEGGSLPWTGPGGARGEVTLHFLPEGALEVRWEAHELGRQLGLISGNATLVRRVD